ncbi:MAG TPA: hypothetical protein VND64_32120 [Pirellulales bacterium]|nr:hypothetical protein [Pirellulales bacterium]
MFVADPRLAPADGSCCFARPDDPCGDGRSWRTVLAEYNHREKSNPFGLLPAYRLYENKTYQQLVDRFGVEKVYILSAGWGLIRSGFLTPYYDITFSHKADPYKRRGKNDCYGDFCMLPRQTDEPIVFFGGKDYLPLFCSLTAARSAKRIVFYNSKVVPTSVPGCTFQRFPTTTRTNWHYECANDFIEKSDP